MTDGKASRQAAQEARGPDPFGSLRAGVSYKPRPQKLREGLAEIVD